MVRLLKLAWARERGSEERLQVLDLVAEETRQDQTQAATLDLAEVSAQAVE